METIKNLFSSSSVYDHYPGNRDQYPLGTPSQYPYPKEDFQQYADNTVIAQSSAKDPDADLIVTSGTLLCKLINGIKQGFTTNYNFRMLCNPMDRTIGKRVRLTDFKTTYFGTVDRWHSGLPNWAGLHIFMRYQTENDLYVASYRFDGKATIKKKVGGTYTSLKVVTVPTGPPQTGKEYTLAFEVEGPNLRYYIDNNLIAETTDTDLAWGTTGVRMDYSDSYVDYLKVESL